MNKVSSSVTVLPNTEPHHVLIRSERIPGISIRSRGHWSLLMSDVRKVPTAYNGI